MWRDIHLGNLRFLAGSLLPWVGKCWVILAYFSEDVWYYLEMFTCRCFTLGVVGNCWCVAEEFLVADQGHLLCCGGEGRVEGCSCLYCLLLLQILAPLPLLRDCFWVPLFPLHPGWEIPCYRIVCSGNSQTYMGVCSIQQVFTAHCAQGRGKKM